MTDEIRFEKSSGNVFRDLGLDAPEERLLKARIASTIYDVVKDQGLSPKKAGLILGISQSETSDLRDGRLEAFSLERLFSFLHALNQDVDVVVHPKNQERSHLTLSYAH